MVMPKRFSLVTNEAIKSGALTPRARDEIIHSLATLITSDDYNTVCTQLVKTYPTLKDQVDGGYVSFLVHR